MPTYPGNDEQLSAEDHRESLQNRLQILANQMVRDRVVSSIQVVATCYIPDEDDTQEGDTVIVPVGAGDLYARETATEEWVIQQKAVRQHELDAEIAEELAIETEPLGDEDDD